MGRFDRWYVIEDLYTKWTFTCDLRRPIVHQAVPLHLSWIEQFVIQMLSYNFIILRRLGFTSWSLSRWRKTVQYSKWSRFVNECPLHEMYLHYTFWIRQMHCLACCFQQRFMIFRDALKTEYLAKFYIETILHRLQPIYWHLYRCFLFCAILYCVKPENIHRRYLKFLYAPCTREVSSQDSSRRNIQV